jgi:hypothetical protein
MTRLVEQDTPLSLPFLLIVMFARWTVLFCELGYFDGTINIIVSGTIEQTMSSGFSVLKNEGIIYNLTMEFSIVFLFVFQFLPS